jgi:hypothetical protein
MEKACIRPQLLNFEKQRPVPVSLEPFLDLWKARQDIHIPTGTCTSLNLGTILQSGISLKKAMQHSAQSLNFAESWST